MMDEITAMSALALSEKCSPLNVDFAHQSDPQKVFTTIWSLEGEVNNGGLEQYFFNHSGETANYAPTALRTVGAHQCAAIVERALATVSDEPLPHDTEQRREFMDTLTDDVFDALNQLDQEFYAYPDQLTNLLYAFVTAHPEFFGRPEDW
jgi:hypothetical protein